MTTRLDQDFLIDVSEEDDSLLPPGNKASHRSFDNLLHSGICASAGVPVLAECDIESIDPAHELPLSQAVSLPDERANVALSVTSEDPAVVKKKKRAGFNVRKSMAWNNAFLTEEGVLDSDELSLVNKTFPKVSGPPKQSNFSTSSSKLPKPIMMPKASLAPHRLVSNAASNPASSRFQGSMETLFESHSTDIPGPQLIKNNANPCLPKAIMATRKKEILNISAHADSCESKPALLRRSIDKTEQGPNFFTSKGGTQLKHGVNDNRSVGHMEAIRPTFTKSTMERLSSTSISEAQPRTGLLKLHSECSSIKAHSALKKSSLLEASGALTCKDKPSGLRMPSPKLGFFDTSRGGSQVAVLRERTNGHGFGGSGPARSKADQWDAEISGTRSSTKGREHSASSVKIGHQLLETSRNQNRGTKSSTRIPMVPPMRGRNAEFASLQLAPAHKPTQPASHLPNAADSTKRVLYARKIGNAAIRRKPATFKEKEQENLSPNCDEGTAMPQKATLALDLAMRKCSMEGHPATFTAKGQENLYRDLKEGMVMPQFKCQGQSEGSPTIIANGNVCTSEIERACDSQASPIMKH
ncbi:hypothetical protein GOP47_0015534 [Adiantum capillus-veneris]|uniref:Uncharacterized protein n=1 Tax=Adiantum capillus-veneris TaxID=13818 RepID=A0A9D4ZBB7_ADICA|nr:hypothetical protein GOP47_0015534 [Adiantum capillus-veneris]